MKQTFKIIFLCFLIFVSGVIALFQMSKKFRKPARLSQEQIEYMGKERPGRVPIIFKIDGLKPHENFYKLSFSPSGRMLLFTTRTDETEKIKSRSRIMEFSFTGDEWLGPQTAFFSGRYNDENAVFAPDGGMIVFDSDSRNSNIISRDIFYIPREGLNWGQQPRAADGINTRDDETYPSLSTNYTLYFTSNRPDGYGDFDIYRAEYSEGKFLNVTNLGEQINTSFPEFDCCISPDESYLVFRSIRPGNRGHSQLFISQKGNRGIWKKAVPMNAIPEIKSPAIYPTISYDGKYFFYSISGMGRLFSYWVSTEVFKDYLRTSGIE